MRNTKIESIDHLPRQMIAVSNVYPDGCRLAPHRHRRGQLLCGTTGVVTVMTAQGSWTTPPHRGMWVPGGMEHEVRMQGIVTTRNLYLEDVRGLMPSNFQVFAISPLLQALMADAVDAPIDYEAGSRGYLETLDPQARRVAGEPRPHLCILQYQRGQMLGGGRKLRQGHGGDLQSTKRSDLAGGHPGSPVASHSSIRGHHWPRPRVAS
jgi:hypothetical protein